MKVHLPDFSMAYRARGEGLPLLLIHGYPLSRQIWKHQLSGLADTACLLAPDLRGFGQSAPLPGPYSVDLLAQDCNDFLDALKITRPVVVCGISMGGYISLAFYRKFAHRVGGLILAGTRPGPDSPQAKAGREKSIQLVQQSGPQAIAEGMIGKMLAPQSYSNRPALVRQVLKIMSSASVEGIAGALYAMRDRPDSTPILSQIHCPTLVIHGAEDQVVPPAEAEATQVAIPNSRLVILAKAGHLLNIEQPRAFNHALHEFLALIT
ncbi:MAG TPA: alpha/beta fold hydrolase [Anaerolineales bacterium]|nr:alpha/beta fold hydrolase [Anaerolineales bacterium]